MPEKLSEELSGDITIPPGIFHNAACISTEDADMIVVYSQGASRFEPEKTMNLNTDYMNIKKAFTSSFCGI